MTGMTVRRALASDAEAVADIAKRPFAARWSREAYAAEAGRADAIFLIAEIGAVRGYAVARVVEADVQLLDLAAAEDGLGAGRRLWEELAQAARSRGASRLTLEVSSANSRARRFYERAGARVVGRRAKFYNDGSDAILMDFPLA